jgi:hypothetical protein
MKTSNYSTRPNKMMIKSDSDHIDLYRSGSIVSSLLGAFGKGLKETRLTTALGFLISSEPKEFMNLFGIDIPTEVSLETFHFLSEECTRSDIIIKTRKGNVVIEAKVGYENPFKQSIKYPGYKKILLTNYLPTQSDRKLLGVIYITWEKLSTVIDKLSKSKKPEIKFLSNDVLKYMEEHSMIPKKESIEIYARELNNEITLNFFLKARMYGCYFEKANTMSQAMYFAPHFAQTITHQHPGVTTGISYVAKIERIEVVETWSDLLNAIQKVRGKSWYNKHKMFVDPINTDWDSSTNPIQSFLFLGEPRLVFNPAIKKENLQKGKGWLSKRTYSFDELFKARSEKIW